jgi:lipoprotein-releasing system permease protein
VRVGRYVAGRRARAGERPHDGPARGGMSGLDALISIWDAVGAIGSSLSVAFIVIIAVVLAVLAIVYWIAALAVLGRFARAATRPGPSLLAAGLSCLAFAALWLRVESPELVIAPWSAWAGALAPTLGRIAPACVASMALYRFALARRLFWRIPLLVAGPAGAGLALAFLADAEATDGWMPTAARSVVIAAVLGLIPLALAGLIEIRTRAEWFIAIRYLVAERKQVVISVITLICVGAVASGVWLIITVLSVMNGFERTWRDEIVGNYAHFLVRSYYGDVVDYPDLLVAIEKVDGVVAVSPYMEADGMVRSAKGIIAPIRLRGIDRERAARVTNLADKLTAGRLEAIDPEPVVADGEDAPAPGLVIGQALAAELGVGLSDELILVSPRGGARTPLGPSPRLMRFRVVGLFESSFLQFDELYAYAALASVQEFIGAADVVGGFEVRTVDFFRSRAVADAVEDTLGHPFFARDWKELFPQFFHALNDNRSLMFLLLIMIMVVSAFVIVVTLMMMIMSKSTDVAILKTMGARDESIEMIFAIEGAIIGFAGVVVGVLSGIAVSTRLSWIQERIEEVTGIDTLPASVYQISTLPSEVDPVQVVAVVSIALVLALGASLLPSRHGARLDPVEALRDE